MWITSSFFRFLIYFFPFFLKFPVTLHKPFSPNFFLLPTARFPASDVHDSVSLPQNTNHTPHSKPFPLHTMQVYPAFLQNEPPHSRLHGNSFSPTRQNSICRHEHKNKPHPAEGYGHFSLILEDSPDCQDVSVICIGYGNTGPLVGCVHNLPVSDIDSHMA